MKKLSLTIFVLICFVAGSFAQSSMADGDRGLSIGVFGGLNIPRLSGGNGNELSRDYSSRSGGAFGLTTSLDLNSHFSLRLDLMYSSEGGKRNGIQAFDASSFSPLLPPGTYLYASYNNESILNYAEIPLLLKYLFPVNKNSKFYADFGPYVGFLLNATQKTSGSSIIYADRGETITVVPQAQSFDASTDIAKSINPVNVGLTGGLGFLQKLGAGRVFIDVRGAYGLLVIQKDKANGSSHNGNLLIDLGYSIHL
jgi:hypothetical protein